MDFLLPLSAIDAPVERSEVNSTAFYFGAVQNDWDWTAPQNGALWQDADKTLFDPCPSGWRVPRSGEGNLSPWRDLTKDNGPWGGKEAESGRYFDQTVVSGSSAAWVPCCGVRASENNGIVRWIQTDAHFWNATPSGTIAYRFYSTTGPKGVEPSGTIHRSRGNSVRCVRE